MLPLMPKMASRATISVMPVSIAMSTIMIEELKKYSIQRP
jgi:uncharacterized membrane protein